MDLKQEKLLIIAPHADDEVLGCCGLINKVKENGGEVFVHVLSIGGFRKIGFGKIKKESWKKEFLKVVKFLKIDDYDISYFDDKKFLKLDTIPQAELINKIELKSHVSLLKIKPTIVAIPTIFSHHQDHIATYKAAIAALRARPQTSDFVPKMVISYESSEYSHWSHILKLVHFLLTYFLICQKKKLIKKLKHYLFTNPNYVKDTETKIQLLNYVKLEVWR